MLFFLIKQKENEHYVVVFFASEVPSEMIKNILGTQGMTGRTTESKRKGFTEYETKHIV